MKIFLQYDWQIDNGFFKKVSHGVYSNPGTQEGGGGGSRTRISGLAVSQTDLNAVSSYNMGPSLGRF